MFGWNAALEQSDALAGISRIFYKYPQNTCNVHYPTQALDQALDHEYDVNQPRRNDRYRESYRSRMLRYEDEVRRGVYAEEQRREMMLGWQQISTETKLRWSELAHGAARSRPKVGDDRHWHLVFVGQKSGIPWRSMGSLLVYITIEDPRSLPDKPANTICLPFIRRDVEFLPTAPPDSTHELLAF
ncbi:hypothetical protein R3P38DRAFT_3366766 [Favolaschia claudopus]|uniref:Uncharacterized protein n=1 Tax=Favolaschia claudopus TaxID=2862362 RepID=A0AAW0AD07_9AGAR